MDHLDNVLRFFFNSVSFRFFIDLRQIQVNGAGQESPPYTFTS